MLVLDASIAVAVVTGQSHADAYRSAIEQCVTPVRSSALMPIEVANALRRYVQTKQMTPEAAQMAYATALSLVDEFVDIRRDAAEALSESIRLQHSVYDLLYFLIARHYGASLLTLDARLMKLCDREGVSTTIIYKDPVFDTI
ncbi:MAG: type II toxin-antitoxin system VapC family toxin [Actinomycetes bacterium]|jgi:predicted nucleic acid-binding protein|nr:type II toxin-antitoxin system VapC family toxin [Actinomycetes bacterium]